MQLDDLRSRKLADRFLCGRKLRGSLPSPSGPDRINLRRYHKLFDDEEEPPPPPAPKANKKPRPKHAPAPQPGAEPVPQEEQRSPLGPRARSDAQAEARWKLREDEEEAARRARLPLTSPASPTHPLFEALESRVLSEEAWQDFVHRIIERDAVEDNAMRRLQLRVSRSLARNAIERALKRLGVTVDNIQGIPLEASADELVDAFIGYEQYRHRPPSLASRAHAPGSPTPSTQAAGQKGSRSRSPERRESPPPLVPIAAGASGEMNAAVAQRFLEGLGWTDLQILRTRLFLVVETYDAEAGIADLSIFAGESDAFAAALIMAGERGIVPPAALERIAGISRADVRLACNVWEPPPRASRPLSHQAPHRAQGHAELPPTTSTSPSPLPSPSPPASRAPMGKPPSRFTPSRYDPRWLLWPGSSVTIGGTPLTEGRPRSAMEC